ncbi:MAG: tetratricopeptide repeat protein [Candidatus Eisenbacteria bacterium]
MSITSKRKAQDLVRQGKIHDAITVLREGLVEGDADPYDHVYMGDLLMRVGETEDCLSAYQKAIRSYEDVGLYRNAVAIGKKMLRIDRQRPEIHRTLASLYDREGLHGEAIPHYLTYLDSFVGEAVPPTEFLETLDHTASITGSKVEVALRLTDHFLRIRRGDRAAALLNEVANNAEAAGSLDMAEDLRRRANDALGQSDASANGASAGPPAPPPLPVAEPVAGFEVSGAADDTDDALLPPPPPPLHDVEPIAFDTSAMDALGAASAEEDESDDSSVALESRSRPGPRRPRRPSGVREVGGAASLPDEDDDSGFVVEHFAGSNAPATLDEDTLEADGDDSPFELGSRPSASTGSDLGFGEVDFSDSDGDEEEDDHVIDLDANASFGEVDLAGTSGASSEYGLDGNAEEDDFGAVDFSAPAPDPAESGATSATELASDTGEDSLTVDGEASDLGSLDAGPGDDHVYEIDADGSDEVEFDLRPVEAGAPGSISTDDDDDAPEAAAEDESDPDETTDAETHAMGTTAAAAHEAQPVTIEDANDAFLAGRWSEARRLYEHILEETPDNRRVLARLVETVRYLQDHHGEIHYLVLLGEVWIEEDELEEALECFLKVVRLDPENATAKRRLSRFREMGVRGAEVIEESDSNSVHGVLETGRSEVAVRGSEESFRSEDWVELEGLLEEFKDGLKSQMDDGDYQGHYDLAVSYHGMGLLEEALEAADLALACEKIPEATERQARELKGSCLTELHRYREAVHEYREAVEKAGSDRQARRTALYHLGRSLEALEEWQEAVDTYVQLKLVAPGFLDVEERIRNCEDQVGDSSSRPPSEAA